MAQEKLPHILIRDLPEATLYTTTASSRVDEGNPLRDRGSHGRRLRAKLDDAWQKEEDARAIAHVDRSGIYLEFRSDPAAKLTLASLEDLRKNIRIVNVRQTSEKVGDEPTHDLTTYATVFVPNRQKRHFAKKIDEYLREDTNSGKPKNARLVESISDIRRALLVESFWTDQSAESPKQKPQWIEVWLRIEEESIVQKFEDMLTKREIRSRPGHLTFPERAVKVVLANRSQLEALTESCDEIAEYRMARSSSAYILEHSNFDQALVVEQLLERCDLDNQTEVSVCILDTGVNNGHPLLAPILSDIDCQAVDEHWGTDDHDKHGTLVAGIAGYGDLGKLLFSSDRVRLRHRLESIKILPPPPLQNEPNLWGYITSQGVSLAEIQAPERKRNICMTVTAEETRDRGRPSSWSAEIDQITSGANDGNQRLFAISAGNTSDLQEAARNYPHTQLTNEVNDPGQSWNAITVGAYTELDQISDQTYSAYAPVASRNQLSPFSTTSVNWELNRWPNKPDVVLEGGNVAIDEAGFPTECDDLALTSTHFQPQIAHFSRFGMTSAAAAKLSWMAAAVQAENPNLWPETIRALLIHSAQWPDELKQQFAGGESKANYKYLLGICGYGVPNLDRALYSARNSLTLIAQQALQPFDKNPKVGGYRTKDMHIYDLPWPKEALLDLPDEATVEMRVTLSYFIEPGPGEIGWTDRYRYASHGLRFDLNSPNESKEEFKKRINLAAREKDEGKPGTKSPSDHWLIGSQARNRGSIHSDIWRGTAAELAASNLIAVTPTIGWWRERQHLKRWDRTCRYSLLVTISTPEESVDLYTPVAVRVGTPIPVEIPVQT